MIRIIALFIVVLIAVTGAATIASATSETVELYMTKAIYAMNIGDDARAFSWFGKVLAIQPENVTALHLQGISASRLGRLEHAEQILKKCIALQDAPLEAHFDLGFVLYSQGRYREAVVQFNIAREAEVKELSIHYYMGASLFRLKEYERAIETLEPVLDAAPEVQANTHFYAGASCYSLGKFRRAQKHLEKTLEIAPGTPVAQKAAELLDATLLERQLAKWWDIRFEMGAAYDTNVLYEPEDFEVTDQAGFYGFTEFSGKVYPLKKRRGNIGAGYCFYQSIHYATDNDVLSEFDLQRHAGLLEGLLRILAGYPGLFLGAEYELSYASLGGRHYQDTHQVLPHLTLTESSLSATRASMIVQTKRFADYQQRDGIFLGPALTQMFSFLNKKGKAAIEVEYQQNNAESDNYDYQGVKGFAGALVPVVGGLSAIGGFQYRYLHYINHAENRIDRKITVDTALQYEFAEFFATQLGYRYARNVSLDRYSWQKNVGSLSFQVRF